MFSGGAGPEIRTGKDHVTFCDGLCETGPKVFEKKGKKIFETGDFRYGGAGYDAVGVDVVLVEDMGFPLDSH
jgi:hypothetical protein